MKIINIYTDGACSGNQNESNVGGWGAILEYKEHKKTLYGGEENTTNNRMEMKALLEALKSLKKNNLILNVFSDSSYLIECFTKKWYIKWQQNGWITSSKKPVENKELWEALLEQVSRQKEIHFYRVKGHLNLNKKTEIDKWYEKFKSWNGNHFSLEDFIYITKMNIEADALANKGIDQIREKTLES
ncbi:ribonuclease HI [Crassaminicella thermophila]|uniref:ribonuclease H n=1 Tax=Crassaminicella thermophila TaxID=2599308 RepID=A0A5C0SK45_CRATE|nr:ribonuclease H [Crassaminicella thermophila]QEK13319.1 ribonuclease HI [Crassaminicella thermophila]